jgi:uncharacterized protein (DUF1697 family)
MTRYAAFLRGMNLGAHRRITNEQLRERFAALGLAEVATFRAAGNVVFTAAGRQPVEKLASHIEQGLQEALGYPVPTYLRSAEETLRIAAATPFAAAAVAASTGKLHVALLAAPPNATTAADALALASEQDLLALCECELYWLPRGRMIDAGLDPRRLEALVGPWTMRTKATIEQLAAKHLTP